MSVPVPGSRAIDRVQHAAQAAAARRGAAMLANLVVEHDEADGVVLARREVRERRREELAVQQLADLAAAEAHRRARVEQDHEPRVGLADVALDVGAVRARVDVPVDEARVVAFGVRAVLGELLAEAEERRAVHAGQEAVDDGARDEIEVREPRKRLRLEQMLRYRASLRP